MKPEGWEKRLFECIEAKRKLPFAWGDHDCSIFVMDCVDAQLNTQYAAQWRGRYKTRVGAYRVLKKEGGYATIAMGYGFKKKPTSQASRGDLAYIGGATAMGVVVGDRIIATGETSLVSLPIDVALYVWEVSCHK